MNQDWNDPKSKLQQCCLTLRTMDGGEPDIPIYKVIECNGPTNTRVYTVAVYFRGKRLACANGHSIQQAEMNAAKQALENSKDLFPQLDHQKRVIAQSLKRQRVRRSSLDERSEDQLDRRGEASSESSHNNERSSESQRKKRVRATASPQLPRQYQVPGGSDSDSHDEREKRKRRPKKPKVSSRSVKKTSAKNDQSKSKSSTQKPLDSLVDQYESLSDEVDLQLEAISESEEDFDKTAAVTVEEDLNTSIVEEAANKSEWGEMPKTQQDTFANSVLMFKVDGTDDVSSDLESGEIE